MGDIHETEITVWDLGELRALGPAQAALKVAERMEAGDVEGFWIHLDADVLDDAIMPAVDSRQPRKFEPEGVGYLTTV